MKAKDTSTFNPEYYVTVWGWNDKKPVSWNIYNNGPFCENAIAEVKKYRRLRNKYKRYVSGTYKNPEYIYGWEAFVKEMRGLLMWQFMSRCEYEMICLPWPCNDKDNDYKIDVFEQCEKNVEIIARDLLYQYNKFLLEKKKGQNDI